jgi:hypothetical protein
VSGKLATYRVVHLASLRDLLDAGFAVLPTFGRPHMTVVLGALVVAGDEDTPAVAAAVDLVEHPNGTIVHLDVLPGVLDNHLALARRVAPAA